MHSNKVLPQTFEPTINLEAEVNKKPPQIIIEHTARSNSNKSPVLAEI